MTGSNSETSSFEIRMIGDAAFDLLSTVNGGKVLASVTGAIYLLCERDELLWLASQTSPLHRRCMQVSRPFPHLQVGESFHLRDGCLVTRTGRILDFAGAPVWEPPVLSIGKTIPVSHLGGLVQSAYHRLAVQKKSGWGVLIPAILQIAGGQAEPEESGNGFFLPGNVWPAVRGILLAGLARNFDPILPYAAGLVGLGIGLTPSGDDFLGGLFFASTLLRCAYPNIPYLQAWNYADFILGCKTQTNLISFTLLNDHSQGHALEPLHLFANALLAGRFDQALPFASELAAVGHSTGWDVLAGFLVGMSVTFPQ
jgi:Protein of unknown function (DUF2877)